MVGRRRARYRRLAMGSFGQVLGSVATFDDHGGYGTVRSEAGTEWPFHCTAITDGSRTIAVGAPVSFDVVPGRLGRWEAANLRTRP
jgi:cold shock CspA family protein